LCGWVLWDALILRIKIGMGVAFVGVIGQVSQLMGCKCRVFVGWRLGVGERYFKI